MKIYVIAAALLLAGCAEASYQTEQARLAAMQAEADELAADILREVSEINAKNRRDLELYEMKREGGMVGPNDQPPRPASIVNAAKRAESDPRQAELIELRKKIENQEKRVGAARAAFTQ